MKTITLALFAAAAIGAGSIGSASAVPFNNVPAALGESHVQDVRVVCGRYHRCYNTRRGYRSSRSYYGAGDYNYAPGYYNRGYYGGSRYGYYGGPRVGVGIGPFGVGVW
jgi:hypothetical protein